MFGTRLGQREHLDNLSFRMCLRELHKEVAARNYEPLEMLYQGFDGIIPPEKTPFAHYNNFCAFRRVSDERYHGIIRILDIFRRTAEGDEQSRRDSLVFIGTLMRYLEKTSSEGKEIADSWLSSALKTR